MSFGPSPSTLFRISIHPHTFHPTRARATNLSIGPLQCDLGRVLADVRLVHRDLTSARLPDHVDFATLLADDMPDLRT